MIGSLQPAQGERQELAHRGESSTIRKVVGLIGVSSPAGTERVSRSRKALQLGELLLRSLVELGAEQGGRRMPRQEREQLEIQGLEAILLLQQPVNRDQADDPRADFSEGCRRIGRAASGSVCSGRGSA